MRYSFSMVEKADRNFGEIAREIGREHPELLEISHDDSTHTVHMIIDDGPAAAIIALRIANKILAVCGEPLHISDEDNFRITNLRYMEGVINSVKELAIVMTAKCREFCESSEFICCDENMWSMPTIGIRASTFQQRRELMIRCVEFMNEKFFQNSPIQLGTKDCSLFWNMTLPIDYGMPAAMPEESAPQSLAANSDDLEDCLTLNNLGWVGNVSVTISANNHDRAKDHLEKLEVTIVKVANLRSENSNRHEIILHGRSGAVTAAVDYLASLHTFVKFSSAPLPEFEKHCSIRRSRTLATMLVDSYQSFCERTGLEEWDGEMLWIIARNCKPNLADNVCGLRVYMIDFYGTADIDWATSNLSQAAVIAAAKAAGVFILQMGHRNGMTTIILAGTPDNRKLFHTYIKE